MHSPMRSSPPRGVDQRLNLVEAATDGPAGSGRVLDQDRTVRHAGWRGVGGLQRTLERLGDLRHAVSNPVPLCEPTCKTTPDEAMPRPVERLLIRQSTDFS